MNFRIILSACGRQANDDREIDQVEFAVVIPAPCESEMGSVCVKFVTRGHQSHYPEQDALQHFSTEGSVAGRRGCLLETLLP